MFLNILPGETITVRIWSQRKIRLKVKVDVTEGRGAYRRNRFEGGTELIPQA